ncbi:uncharacterized protein LY89DRAFT_467387 [Mollisia scopiformis]|uniref:Uncharacterized protein n=1 Tax=Mollisia scopiformis TaxID=149040 RepID=A0A194XIH0_MOLSC|nr:uncharacterized protein LY89DRAFT_467387 [Mollisia scopiformis]KUJ19958.1 hypothetical protein LY89DRAFT_467387 [Mollisia scopiformis]
MSKVVFLIPILLPPHFTSHAHELEDNLAMRGLGSAVLPSCFNQNSVDRGPIYAEKRPPITFLVHNNRRMNELEDSNASIGLVENENCQFAKGFDVEVLAIPENTMATRLPTTLHLRYMSGILKTTQGFDVETEPDLDPYDWDPQQAEFLHHNPVIFQGDTSVLSFGADDNRKLVVRSDLIPQDVNTYNVKYVRNEDAMKSQEYIRNYILPSAPRYVCSTLNGIKHRLRPDSIILFL